MLFLANWLNDTLTIQSGYAELAYLQEQFMHGVDLVKTVTQHPLVKFTDEQQGNKADEQLVISEHQKGAENRLELGHWEADTAVDRKSR